MRQLPEILLPEDGTYFFALVGDDGVRLWLDGELVGQSLHPDASNAVEARRTLKAGSHSIRVEYFQRSGAKLIEFRWARPGAALELVPPEVLRSPNQQGHRVPGVALAERHRSILPPGHKDSKKD